MDKQKVIAEIQNYLAEELSELAGSGSHALKDNAVRIQELQQLLTMYKFLPVREYSAEDVICPGGLVELELNGMHAYYLIVPKGGGLVMRVDGQAVQVITPNSPLGEVLMGRKVGEQVSVQVGTGARSYNVVGFY